MSVLRTCNLHPQQTIYQSSALFDDFYNYTTTGAYWTTAPSGSGSVVATAPDNAVITTAGTDNDPEGVRSTLAPFTYTSGVGMECESLISFTNQSGNNANIFFGFTSTTSITSTNGAVPSASMTNALIMKLDGEAFWRVQTSNATAKSNNLSTTPAAGSSTQSYLLHIDVFNFDGLNAGVSFSVNGVALLDSITGLQIVHHVPYSAAAAMYLWVAAQAGSANAQALAVDYLTASKFRNISLSAV